MSANKITSLKDLKAAIKEQSDLRKAETRPILTVSAGTCGLARGSKLVIDSLRRTIKKEKLEKKVKVKVTGCHGFCEAEPNIIIHPKEIFYQKVSPNDAGDILNRTILKKKVIDELLYVDANTGVASLAEADIPFYKKQMRLVLGDNALLDPTDIYDYLSIGGYGSLLKVLSTLTPEAVIEQIKRSGLRGRGGAGFPTATKWELARKVTGDTKYVICNADEGDPGAYMDRSLLEGNPHRVLEGMMIGGFAIGSSRGYMYVRDEYPLAVRHISRAIEQASELGLLGENIFGTGFSFDIQIAKGAGAFVCGEETALIASIEGRVGEPRQRPPFPAVKGLWGKPTNINNVETWGNVPLIIQRGGDWFAKIGTEGSKGTKIFSLVGKINNTGLVEVPMGISLREIIYDIGGGIPGDKAFKAVQTGGPSGGCLPKEMLDLPIDYQSLNQAGAIMGSGGMIIMDENTCMVDIAKYFLNFLRDESCGKCLSCREGTQRMWEIVKDVSDGKGKEGDLELLKELALAVKDSSLCGLGQTAANPVLSTLRYFRDEYETHIKDKKCPALVCKEIVSAPCHYVCPIGQEAETYVALIARGDYKEAFNIIMKDNPLPSVCGRVCNHPCEKVCRAGESGEPISIRGLKRFVMDWAEKRGIRYAVKPGQQDREKVAIVGSGPAGLAAAYSLALKGFRPTIFEALPIAGGMLGAAIPEHRLPKKILNKEIENIKKAGVEIKTSMALGRDFTLDQLILDGYKAAFLATGAWKSMAMGIPGEDSEGVLESLEYLKSVNLGQPLPVGKHVCVVGGGNSAIDAARVAIRDTNCQKVTILYRRTKKEMPAFPEEVDAAIDEGVDVRFLVAPVKVFTKGGKITGVECVRMKLGEKDSSGRRKPIPIKGSNFKLNLDTLILAVGERPETSYISPYDGLSLAKENIVADEETGKTTREGVFAGGDAVTGPNTVVDAMASGKMAADAIEKYLSGQPLARTYGLTRPSLYVRPVELSEEEVAKAERSKMPHLKPAQRRKNFKEVELGFNEPAACREARRCLRCELETEDGKKALGEKP